MRPRRSFWAAGTLLALVAASGAASAASAGVPLQAAVGVETPATATDLRTPSSQNSPLLLVDPTDARVVVLAHRQDAPTFGCGLEVSGDSGRSWVPTNPVPHLPEGADVCYAPEIAFDHSGVLYYLFIALAGLGNNPTGVYVATSADHGRTFSAPRSVLGPGNYQARMTIDASMGKTGRLYLVWLHAASDSALGALTPDPNPLFSAYSDDGGKSWSKPVQVSDPARARVVAPAIAVGEDHAVHIAYYDLQDDVRDYQGLEGPPWDGNWSVVVTSSTDRGRRFSPGVVVDDKLAPPGRVMLIYTMAPPTLAVDGKGRVLVSWTDARNGDPDVFVASSGDRGRTFSARQRVNDDPVGNGKDQYLPRLGVSPGGRVDLVFFDRRNDWANLRNDVYLSWSKDGGRTFAPNVKVTSQSSDTRIGQRYLVPSAAGLVEIGGRIGLLSRSTSVVAAWPDMRNAALGSTQQDVFTTTVRFPGASEDGSGGVFQVVPVGAGLVVLAVASGFFVHRRSLSRKTV